MSVQYLDTPDKSESDKKDYRFLCLPNGIKILLVSDPSPVPDSSDCSDDETSNTDEESSESENDEMSIDSTSTESQDSDDDYEDSEEGDERLAACALMIDVGSFSDPVNIQGLAHFLEHMIFMGSEKYPEENAYDAHIKKCGGFDNADTECEETSFYFEVPDEHLDSSIERFVSLFVAPLMKKEAMTRERDAVESEFKESLQDDEQRRNQILASELGNPTHPCSIFTWGNSKTLKDNIDDEELYQRLHEFRKKNYSSHRMYGCIQARLPLDDLEHLAIKHFSIIPNNEIPKDDFSMFNHKNAFKDEFYDNVIFVKPVTNIIKVDFTWCLPSQIEQYRTKAHHYLAYLFGNEGSGSLCGYLRKKLWALDLVAGVDDAGFECNSLYSLFNICIYLTENGFKNLDNVISATFSYIKMLQNVDSHKQLFDELQYIEDIDFRYQTERSAFDNCQDLVVNMKYFPPKDILTGPNLYFEYNQNDIQDLIDFISEKKFNIMITSYIKYDQICYDRTEKWFGTEYTSFKIPERWIDSRKNVDIISELHFPDFNPFISKNFEIFWKEDGQPTLPLYPKKIIDNDICELWFRQDDKFLLPEAYMYFYFISPLVLENTKNSVLLALYANIVKYELVEQLYPATVAGFGYQFYSSEKGIVLKVCGYNEKLHLIVDIITRAMINFVKNLNEDDLQVHKEHQQKNYFNALIKPKTLNKDIRLSIVEHIHWPMNEKYNILKDVTIDEINDFAHNLFKEMKIKSLMQGNIKEETAHNIMNSIITNFDSIKIKNPKLVESRTCQIPLGSNYIICNTINTKDVNTVITNFYQIGPCKLRTECLLDLLLMLVEEPLFDILRTKEQLGYDVSASIRNNNGVLGYSITVNSQENKFSSSYVQMRIEAFRTKIMEILNEMEVDEFEHIKESLIKTKQVADNGLKEEVVRNWSEIVCEDYIFDKIKREIECLKSLTKQDILDFCYEYEKNDFRKLSVQIVGNKNAVENNETENNCDDNNEKLDFDVNEQQEKQPPMKDSIELDLIKNDFSTIMNIQEFKNNLIVHPVIKTLIDFPQSSIISY